MLAQLSDLHLRAGAPSAEGRLLAAVRSLAEVRPRPDALLLSGDVADDGAPASYERVRELLAPLGLPLHAVPGNHDDPEALAACFGPVRFAARCGPLRLIGCDTRLAGRDDGRLDAEQLAWLDASLAEAPDVPAIVAMHHPPIQTGARAADAMGLPAADRAGLAEVVARHPQVRLVTCGHVHRTTLGTVGGRPVLIAPSIERPALLDLDPGSERGLVLVDEPPAYVLHALVDGELRSHVQPA